MSPFVFADAVVEPCAVLVPFAVVVFGRVAVVVAGRAVAVSRSRVVTVVVAGRAVVAVFGVDGGVVAGLVNSLALPVSSVPVVVQRRVGERCGKVEAGRGGGKEKGHEATDTK